MDKICTIVGKNYLPQAITLLESVRTIYPNIHFSVLIIDSDEDFSQFLPDAHIVRPKDLPLRTQWFEDMKQYYDQVELATSLKPFLLKYLLDETTSTVTYLDPDVQLFGKLSVGIRAAIDVGIAITPHRISPSSINDVHATDFSFLKYGTYNLGYIAVGQKSKNMLEWWAERLRWFSTRFPEDFIFTDQKWINLVPAYFETRIIRDTGYNVASWNIDERRLTRDENGLRAGDSELVFIHYSQMSGALAKGNDPKLWETIHSIDSRTLSVINSLTSNYSSNLVRTSKFLANSHLNSELHDMKRTPDIFSRKWEIYRNFENSLRNSNYFTKSVKPKKILILNKVQRSSALRGFIFGFKTDLQAIRMKIKKYF
jgi:hypothetical protein